MCCIGFVGKAAEPPKWIKPQLTRNGDEAPAGDDWLHEIKYDGYRMHARLDSGKIRLLTRTGLDWSRRYPRTVEALRSLAVKTAYLDGELCGLRPDGVPAFSRLQAAMDEGRTDDLVFIVFDLLFLNGKDTAALPRVSLAPEDLPRPAPVDELFKHGARERRIQHRHGGTLQHGGVERIERPGWTRR